MTNQTIVIIGFMGSGKTTVGSELARLLNCRAVDLDSWITEREQRSPAEIIEQDGEAAFRRIETRGPGRSLAGQRPAVLPASLLLAAAPGHSRRIVN